MLAHFIFLNSSKLEPLSKKLSKCAPYSINRIDSREKDIFGKCNLYFNGCNSFRSVESWWDWYWLSVELGSCGTNWIDKSTGSLRKVINYGRVKSKKLLRVQASCGYCKTRKLWKHGTLIVKECLINQKILTSLRPSGIPGVDVMKLFSSLTLRRKKFFPASFISPDKSNF
jgi:hypothetical protein